MSSSRLGEKLPAPLDMRRPTCAWEVAGKSRHSISTVVFVEGISTPKCRVMDGCTVVTSSRARLYRPARGGGPLDRVDQLVALDGELEVDVEGPAATQSVGGARVRLR